MSAGEVDPKQSGVVALNWLEVGTEERRISGEIIEEALITLYLNGRELATIMGTPQQLAAFGLGFLVSEGLIDQTQSIDHIHVSSHSCCVDIWTRHPVSVPERRIITSGCGGGVTFEDPEVGLDALKEDLSIDPQKLIRMFGDLQGPTSLYARSRGVHTAGLTDGNVLFAMAEDVGRHNAVDKLIGLCLQRGIETRGRILLTTGRVSSEMLKKGARMGCPLIASRNSPTSLSVQMAIALNITLIGYVRRASMRVYSFPERLQKDTITRIDDLSISN